MFCNSVHLRAAPIVTLYQGIIFKYSNTTSVPYKPIFSAVFGLGNSLNESCSNFHTDWIDCRVASSIVLCL